MLSGSLGAIGTTRQQEGLGHHFCGCSGGLYQAVSMSGLLVPKQRPMGAVECRAPQHQGCRMGPEGTAVAALPAISTCPGLGLAAKSWGESSGLGNRRLMGTVHLANWGEGE